MQGIGGRASPKGSPKGAGKARALSDGVSDMRTYRIGAVNYDDVGRLQFAPANRPGASRRMEVTPATRISSGVSTAPSSGASVLGLGAGPLSRKYLREARRGPDHLGANNLKRLGPSQGQTPYTGTPMSYG